MFRRESDFHVLTFLLFIFLVSLEQSLWFLHKYVGEAAEKGETLDEVLVPMLEHVFSKNFSVSSFKTKFFFCQ